MRRILILLLSVLLNFSAEVQAEEDIAETPQIVEEEQEKAQLNSQMKVEETENNMDLSGKENPGVDELVVSSPQIEVEVEKSLPVQEINLPSCEDEKLLELAKDYITSYFENSKNEGTLYRRYRHFILHNLNQFIEVNVANYKTAQAAPVSDMIADIKVNKGIMEENIRLCKNQSKDRYAGKMYMIIYPKEAESFQVDLVNLTPNKSENKNTGFVFTN